MCLAREIIIDGIVYPTLMSYFNTVEPMLKGESIYCYHNRCKQKKIPEETEKHKIRNRSNMY
jgi:hypothetical protein